MSIALIVLLVVIVVIAVFAKGTEKKPSAPAAEPQPKQPAPLASRVNVPDYKFTVTYDDGSQHRPPIVLNLDLDGEPVIITINEESRAACEDIARKKEHSLADMSVLKQGFDAQVQYKGETYTMRGTRGEWWSNWKEHKTIQDALAPLVLVAIGYEEGKWAIRPAKDNFKPVDGLKRIDLSVQNELTDVINDQPSKYIKDNYYIFKLESGQEFAVGISLDNPWLDVVARGRKKGEKEGLYTGSYATHGFHAEESRWSYGNGPPGAAQIRKLLKEHFGTPERRRLFV